MSSRGLLMVALALALAAGAVAVLVLNSSAPEVEPVFADVSRPNIVLILVDTLRADHLPFYGYGVDTAPFLSALASESVVFENAFSTASSTAPATASLFTSLLPEQHGVVQGRVRLRSLPELEDPTATLNRIPEAATTLGELMKRAGYATWGISANYNVSQELGFAQGFDRFIARPDSYWGAEEMDSRLRAEHGSIGESAPYFLYLHYIDPHSPYHERKPWYRKPNIRPMYRRDAAALRERTRAKLTAQYDSEIAYLDKHIEEMFRLFQWDRNTLFILTSDHGEEFYDHGGLGHGKTLYDEVLKIPLMIHDTSGRLQPGRIDVPVSIIDLLPSLVDYLQMSPPPWIQGESSLPLIEEASGARVESRGKSGSPRSAESGAPTPNRLLFAHLERFLSGKGRKEGDPERYVARVAMSGEWKLIEDSRGEALLFRRGVDPEERSSVVDSFPDEAKMLSHRLHDLAQLQIPFGHETADLTPTPAEMELLRSLGYTD